MEFLEILEALRIPFGVRAGLGMKTPDKDDPGLILHGFGVVLVWFWDGCGTVLLRDWFWMVSGWGWDGFGVVLT